MEHAVATSDQVPVLAKSTRKNEALCHEVGALDGGRDHVTREWNQIIAVIGLRDVVSNTCDTQHVRAACRTLCCVCIPCSALLHTLVLSPDDCICQHFCSIISTLFDFNHKML